MQAPSTLEDQDVGILNRCLRHPRMCGQSRAVTLESPLIKCHFAKIGKKYSQYLADLRVAPAKTYECSQNDREDYQRACAWHPSKGKPPPCPESASPSSYSEQVGFMLSTRALGLRFGNMFCAAITTVSSDQAFRCMYIDSSRAAA